MASLPYPIPHTIAFMLHYTSKHYLVISESRTHYFLVDEFNVCRKYDDILICPSLGPIYYRNTERCELALFLEKKSLYLNFAKHKLTKSFYLYSLGMSKDGFMQPVI